MKNNHLVIGLLLGLIIGCILGLIYQPYSIVVGDNRMIKINKITGNTWLYYGDDNGWRQLPTKTSN
jgi:hypothetical protein